MQRILIATLGMAPAVVTETLWALAQRTPPWRPDRIEIITTARGLRSVRQDLSRPGGPLATLFPAPSAAPPVAVFVPLRDIGSARVRALDWNWLPIKGWAEPAAPADGAKPVDDVDDAEAAICMGDLILERVDRACRGGENQLHLSISGGRKTMSAHALYSLGLVGNPQDEASHVLLGADFDGHPGFWHPDQGGLIHGPAQVRALRAAGISWHDWPPPDPDQALDPVLARSELRLFPIAAPRFESLPRRARATDPLPRLSVLLDQRALAGEWLRGPRLVLHPACNTVTLNGVTRRLDAMDFVWLRLLATAADEGWTSAQDHGQPPGAVTAARLLYGAPDQGRLTELRRWFEAAVTAGLTGDEVARKASQRTGLLGGAKATGKQNLAARLRDWQARLDQSARRSPKAHAAEVALVAAELMAVIGSFTKLRDHLARAFGLPVADTLLPRRTTRAGEADGLPQAGYALAGARPGFLTVQT